MMQSENVNELSAALAKAQGVMKTAAFNKTNPHFKSKYADLASVLEAIREPLANNALSLTQVLRVRDHGLVLVTVLRHSSGQWVESEYPLPATARPQELGSALTYARRYSLSAITCIAAEEDDDGNAAEAAHGRRPKPPAGNVMKEPEQPAPSRAADPHALTPPAAGNGAGDPSDLMAWDSRLATAAEQGTEALRAEWSSVPTHLEQALRAAVNRRHKPRATEVDARYRS